jgi:CrcB protein
MLVKVLGLALAGALGTLCRVGLSAAVTRWVPSFPWGTVVVNVLGSFLFGLVWALSFHHKAFPPDLRWLVLGGFMGAFTTFSTYVFDTVRLTEISGFRAALAYFVLQNIMAFASLWAGVALGRSG